MKNPISSHKNDFVRNLYTQLAVENCTFRRFIRPLSFAKEYLHGNKTNAMGGHPIQPPFRMRRTSTYCLLFQSVRADFSLQVWEKKWSGSGDWRDQSLCLYRCRILPINITVWRQAVAEGKKRHRREAYCRRSGGGWMRSEDIDGLYSYLAGWLVASINRLKEPPTAA